MSQISFASIVRTMPSPEQYERTTGFVQMRLPEFLNDSARIPIAPGAGSMSTAEAFWLYWLVRELEPTRIIDSGSANGWGAHLLSLAAPDARIHCFDPYREPDSLHGAATYECTDWTSSRLDWKGADTLALFDDHANQGLRARQAYQRGVRNALFHDVYPTLTKSLVSLRFTNLIGVATSSHTFEPLWHIDEVFRNTTSNPQLFRWLTWVELNEHRPIAPRSALLHLRQRVSLRNPGAAPASRKNWRARG